MSANDPEPKLMTLGEISIKMEAKVVRHGRYITFQLAEVAILRTLFVEILWLIDGLLIRNVHEDRIIRLCLCTNWRC